MFTLAQLEAILTPTQYNAIKSRLEAGEVELKKDKLKRSLREIAVDYGLTLTEFKNLVNNL